MTEAEWVGSADANTMLRHLEGGASERKLRLLAVAFCERIRHLVTDDRGRRAVAALRRFADGRATTEEVDAELGAARVAAGNAVAAVWASMLGADVARRAARAVGQLYAVVGVERVREVEVAVAGDVAANALSAVAEAVSCVWGARADHVPPAHYLRGAAAYAARAAENAAPGRAAGQAERFAQRALLADIFGNPFRPVAVTPAWRTSPVLALARQMYESRNFGPMPILADALQDAGCDEPDVLDHCRSDGPHVRGCWVVDRVLGKG